MELRLKGGGRGPTGLLGSTLSDVHGWMDGWMDGWVKRYNDLDTWSMLESCKGMFLIGEFVIGSMEGFNYCVELFRGPTCFEASFQNQKAMPVFSRGFNGIPPPIRCFTLAPQVAHVPSQVIRVSCCGTPPSRTTASVSKVSP